MWHNLFSIICCTKPGYSAPLSYVLWCWPPGELVVDPVKPQLQIRAGADKSTDTREIINRYRKLGITRSILRCAAAFTMLIMYGSKHWPIRISSKGVDFILGDGNPLHWPITRREYCNVVRTAFQWWNVTDRGNCDADHGIASTYRRWYDDRTAGSLDIARWGMPHGQYLELRFKGLTWGCWRL